MKAKLIDRTHMQSHEAKHQVFVSSMFVLLSGLGLGLSHLPLPLGWLAWISLIPLLLLWDRRPSLEPRDLFQLGAEIFTAFLIAYAIAFFWPLLRTFTGLHVLGKTTLLSFGGMLLIPAAFTLPFLASLPYRHQRGRGVGFAVFVVFYLSVELLFMYADFPWPILGHTQAGLAVFVQFIDMTGVTGLSLWILLLNGLCFAYFAAKRRKVRIRTAFAVIVMLGLTIGFGLWRQDEVSKTSSYVTVGLVQPVMEPSEWTEQFGAPRVSKMIHLSDSLIAAMNAPPIFMIWPEMAIPVPATQSRGRFVEDRLQEWTEHQEVALLTGALVPASHGHRPERFFNRALLFRPFTEKTHYDQVHELPYSPQVPVRQQSPWMAPPRNPRFIPGYEQRTLSFDGVHIGVLVDFEVLLGDYARRYPTEQADFLAVLTTDGWWGDAPGYRQHLNYLRLRSIETRRSIVQVATNGSTALLGPDGSVIYEAEAGRSTARLAAVPLFKGITFYSRFGNWLGFGALFITLGILAWSGVLYGWHYWQALDGEPEQVEALPG